MAPKIVQGDPKREDSVFPYVRPNTTFDTELAAELANTFASILASVALFLKWRPFAWLALICLVSAWANRNHKTLEFTSMILSTTICLGATGLVYYLTAVMDPELLYRL